MARVLLVEPNDHLRRVFRRRFEREGFELMEAVDGEGALGVARLGMPDVIVVERSVRDAAGLDLPGLLARDPALRGVPLIVLEGRERSVGPHHASPDAGPDSASASSDARAPNELGDRLLLPLLKALRHPFRPGRLVELARGVIASGADPSSGA